MVWFLLVCWFYCISPNLVSRLPPEIYIYKKCSFILRWPSTKCWMAGSGFHPYKFSKEFMAKFRVCAHYYFLVLFRSLISKIQYFTIDYILHLHCIIFIRYTYRLGHRLSDGTYIWSKLYSFKSSPFPGQDSLQRVIMFGDMGKVIQCIVHNFIFMICNFCT